MRNFFFLPFLIILTGTGFGQAYNDTIYFKSGYEKACNILSYDQKNVQYNYVTQRGDVVTSYATDNKMKYFVIYDSLGAFVYSSRVKNGPADTTVFMPLPDSMLISPHMLSVNPFSAALLGLNLDYTVRFGQNYKFGLHIPFRFGSPILWPGVLFYTGLGFSFFPYDSEKFSMVLSATPSFYFIGDVNGAFAMPMTIGFVRYFTRRIALDGYAGAGPGIIDGHLYTAPALHIGVAFLLGDQVKIKASK